VEEALGRARRRDDQTATREGRFEAEALAFHRRVAEGYDALALEFSDRIVTVDASGSMDEVGARLLRAVEARLGA
jgi:dTMP kinase